jgi:hypothetical protein
MHGFSINLKMSESAVQPVAFRTLHHHFQIPYHRPVILIGRVYIGEIVIHIVSWMHCSYLLPLVVLRRVIAASEELNLSETCTKVLTVVSKDLFDADLLWKVDDKLFEVSVALRNQEIFIVFLTENGLGICYAWVYLQDDGSSVLAGIIFSSFQALDHPFYQLNRLLTNWISYMLPGVRIFQKTHHLGNNLFKMR